MLLSMQFSGTPMTCTCRIKPLWVSSSPPHLLRKGVLRFKLPFEMFSFSGLLPLKTSVGRVFLFFADLHVYIFRYETIKEEVVSQD